MRVFMASTSYPANREDWRGRFIFDMTEALALTRNINLQVWCPPGDLPSGVQYAASDRDKKWLSTISADGGIAHLLRKRPVIGLIRAASLLLRLRKGIQHSEAVDVVHCNWLQTALALWRLDHPSLITVLGSDMRLLKLPGITALLRRVLAQRACVLAPNAEWMVPELTKRFGDICEVAPVPFGVKASWFEIARAPSTPPQWLVISRLTHDKLGPLFEWGKCANELGHKIHLFGPMQELVTIPDWIQYHGATHPHDLHERWFPNAMGLITLSRHAEGRPQVMLEAMAAGLPIIATDMQAHRDFIQHGKTGLLVNSAEEFRVALATLAAPDKNIELGHAAQKWVKQAIGTWSDCAQRYYVLYQKLGQRIA